MLRIRADQMELFSERARRLFEDELVEEVLDEAGTSPGAGGAEEERARDLVRQVLVKAKRYAIEHEGDVRELLWWCLRRGPEFERDEGMEEVRALLEDRDLPGYAKVDLVRMELDEEG